MLFVICSMGTSHTLHTNHAHQQNYSQVLLITDLLLHSEERPKYNSATDNVRDITCWRCGTKRLASFMCNLLPPQRGSPIATLRNTSCHSQDSNNQRNTPFFHSKNIPNGRNFSPRGATCSNFADSRHSSNRISTRPVATRENESHTINCIKTNTNKRALIPAIINKNTEIQALCNPCSDIQVIQQSCFPADFVIQSWTDGEFQVVDHELKHIDWITLHISVGKIDHFMPKADICTQLLFSLILGFDWQQQVQFRSCISCIHAFTTLTAHYAYRQMLRKYGNSRC
ncbi:hypothetical protein AVEN_77558-1 [Araneus ventricosus]|uniref:Uncharacterized protein n=1 Tax=Araneus ventricosus TaxID=182803 RepID=A0A4Y2IB78_ARAVE|nr:hypothetical protein AVEN_77558-1 [Araneus ventricosus]